MAKQAALRLGGGSSSTLDAAEFADFARSYLAPFAVRETGRPLAASGDRSVLEWMERELVDEGRFGSTPNLMKLAARPELMAQLEDITDSSDSHAVIGLKYASAFPHTVYTKKQLFIFETFQL